MKAWESTYLKSKASTDPLCEINDVAFPSLSRVDFIGGVDACQTRYSRDLSIIWRGCLVTLDTNPSPCILGTFPTALLKPIHHFHAYRLHHWAEWLLPCHKKPGVQRFSDIRGVMTVSLSWEITINSVFGIRFVKEPLRRLRTDFLEFLKQFLEFVGCFRCCHLWGSYKSIWGSFRDA